MKQISRFIWAGIVIGAAFYAGLLVGGQNSSENGSTAPDLQITRSALLDALEPSPEQRTRLERVIEATRVQADSVMGDLLSEIRDLTREAEAQMRVILTPEQGAMLDTLIARPFPNGQMQQRQPRN